jgi:hypothetical protein
MSGWAAFIAGYVLTVLVAWAVLLEVQGIPNGDQVLLVAGWVAWCAVRLTRRDRP